MGTRFQDIETSKLKTEVKRAATTQPAEVKTKRARTVVDQDNDGTEFHDQLKDSVNEYHNAMTTREDALTMTNDKDLEDLFMHRRFSDALAYVDPKLLTKAPYGTYGDKPNAVSSQTKPNDAIATTSAPDEPTTTDPSTATDPSTTTEPSGVGTTWEAENQNKDAGGSNQENL